MYCEGIMAGVRIADTGCLKNSNALTAAHAFAFACVAAPLKRQQWGRFHQRAYLCHSSAYYRPSGYRGAFIDLILRSSSGSTGNTEFQDCLTYTSAPFTEVSGAGVVKLHYPIPNLRPVCILDQQTTLTTNLTFLLTEPSHGHRAVNIVAHIADSSNALQTPHSHQMRRTAPL